MEGYCDLPLFKISDGLSAIYVTLVQPVRLQDYRTNASGIGQHGYKSGDSAPMCGIKGKRAECVNIKSTLLGITCKYLISDRRRVAEIYCNIS